MSEPIEPGRAPDEWTLMAYAEGRLDAASSRGREVAAWLLTHPQARRQVDEHARQDREIRAAFAETFAAPVPARLLPSVIRRRQRRERWRWSGAAVGAAAVVGVLLALPITQRAPADGLDGFAQDVLQQIEADAPSMQTATTQARQVLMPTGFELAGERSLQARSGTLTEQLYRDAGGRSLRLFIGIDPPDPAIEPQWLRAGGQHVVYWEADGQRYALASEIDQSELQQLAAQVTPMADDSLQLAGDAAVAQTTEVAETVNGTAFEPAAQPASTAPAGTPVDVGVDPYGQIEIRSDASEQPLL